MKNHYTHPGQNGIAAEMIKFEVEGLHNQIYKVVIPIWEKEEMPIEWKIARLTPIYKKGNERDCENNTKTTANCIKVKLQLYAENAVREYQ